MKLQMKGGKCTHENCNGVQCSKSQYCKGMPGNPSTCSCVNATPIDPTQDNQIIFTLIDMQCTAEDSYSIGDCKCLIGSSENDYDRPTWYFPCFSGTEFWQYGGMQCYGSVATCDANCMYLVELMNQYGSEGAGDCEKGTA